LDRHYAKINGIGGVIRSLPLFASKQWHSTPLTEASVNCQL
jgi:hypothetical protein